MARSPVLERRAGDPVTRVPVPPGKLPVLLALGALLVAGEASMSGRWPVVVAALAVGATMVAARRYVTFEESGDVTDGYRLAGAPVWPGRRFAAGTARHFTIRDEHGRDEGEDFYLYRTALVYPERSIGLGAFASHGEAAELAGALAERMGVEVVDLCSAEARAWSEAQA